MKILFLIDIRTKYLFCVMIRIAYNVNKHLAIRYFRNESHYWYFSIDSNMELDAFGSDFKTMFLDVQCTYVYQRKHYIFYFLHFVHIQFSIFWNLCFVAWAQFEILLHFCYPGRDKKYEAFTGQSNTLIAQTEIRFFSTEILSPRIVFLSTLGNGFKLSQNYDYYRFRKQNLQWNKFKETNENNI